MADTGENTNNKILIAVGMTNTQKGSVVDVPLIVARLFNDNKNYTLTVPITWETSNGRETITEVTGKDLNYAVRTVYAEAGGLKDGTQEERKAMADLLTNRIGCLGMKDGKRPRTYTEVVNSPEQFESYGGGRNASSKFFKGGKPRRNLRGDEVKSWNLSYEAVSTEIKEFGGSGPKYPYTSNRKAGTVTGSEWVRIGASVFRTDKTTRWKKVGNDKNGKTLWQLEKQGIERERTPHPND